MVMARSNDDLLRLGYFYPVSPLLTMTPSLRDRSPDVNDLKTHVTLARHAEKIGLDYIFMFDRWETNGPRSRAAGVNNPVVFPMTLAAMMLASTERIGIAPTIHINYFAPVVIARMGANLDALSGGRWAMNAVCGSGFDEGLVPEPARSLGHDERYDLGHEAMDIIKRLWRGERIDHKGKYFEVQGQLIDPLPVQDPHPMIINAGASPTGLDFAAAHADYTFYPGLAGVEKGAEFRRTLDSLVEKHGRRPQDVKLQTSVGLVVRDSLDEAEAVRAELMAAVDLEIVREWAASISSISQTFKDVIDSNDVEAEAELRRMGAGASRMQLFGTAESVAEQLVAMHRDYYVRGIVLDFLVRNPQEVLDFGAKVLPLLREAGVWEHPDVRGNSW